jgi:hypothetical protein
MTTEELVTLIELRQKFKCEISEEDFQAIRPLKSDPEKYDFDISNGKIVKRYTSHIYGLFDNVEYYCKRFRNNLKKRGYNIKSFRYLDGGGSVVSSGSLIAQQFSVAFTNPK